MDIVGAINWMVGKPRILLINLNQQDGDSEVERKLGQHCGIAKLSDVEAIPKSIQTIAPHAICFEYDYPNIQNLGALQKTKLFYPSIPIVMVTKQHSENLSVWAFRSRVWDYFVKPLPAAEALQCFKAIQALPCKRQQNAPREFAMRKCALPVDTRFQDSSLSRNSRFLNTVTTYVEHNLDKKITQTNIAEICGMSNSQFSRAFKQAKGTTFQEYVLRHRVSQAIRLLQNPSASISDVCYTVGFNDQSHFCHIFRRYMGTSPSAYRKNLETAYTSLSLVSE